MEAIEAEPGQGCGYMHSGVDMPIEKLHRLKHTAQAISSLDTRSDGAALQGDQTVANATQRNCTPAAV